MAEKVQYYSAPWCQPCKTYGPVIQQAAADLDIEIEKFNIDEMLFVDLDLAGVQSVPTLVFEGERLVGAKSPTVLYDWLRRVVKNDKNFGVIFE